jgi:hypothetical protein
MKRSPAAVALVATLLAVGTGVACNYLPTADQYMPGFSQIHCIRGSTSPIPKPPLETVSLRVYESAAARTHDLAALNSHNVAALVGPNWVALPDPDFPLPVLRAALDIFIQRRAADVWTRTVAF